MNEGSIRTKGVFSFLNKSNKNKVIQNSPAAYSKKASKRFGKIKSVCGRVREVCSIGVDNSNLALSNFIISCMSVQLGRKWIGRAILFFSLLYWTWD